MCSEMRIAMLSQIPSLWECLPVRVSVGHATRHRPEEATTMDDAKLQIAHAPLDAGAKISTHSVSFAAALAHKDLSSRHSAITADLYSYHRYKVWTSKIRNAFEGAK